MRPFALVMVGCLSCAQMDPVGKLGGALAVTNDDIDQATAVGIPYTTSQDTSEATTADDDPSCAGNDHSVWFKLTVTQDAFVRANTFGSDYDTTLSVWTGTRGSLGYIACNDDSSDLQSQVGFVASPGTDYYVMVASYYGTPGGALVLNVDAELPGPTDLSVFSSAFPSPVGTGGALSVAEFAYNDGPNLATGVTVTHTIPSEVDPATAVAFAFQSDGNISICPQNGRVFTCSLGALPPTGGSWVDVEMIAPSTPGTIVNTASVAGNEADPFPDNNTWSETTAVVVPVDIAVSVSAPAQVSPLRRYSYNVTVTNNGPADATSVYANDALPFGVLAVSAKPTQGTCGIGAQDAYDGFVGCTLGDLAAGKSASITIVADPRLGGTASDFAYAAANEPESNWANNYASATTTFVDPRPPNIYTSSGSYPVRFGALVPCANGGDGDFVILEGDLHEMFSYTYTKRGGRFSFLGNPQGISGYGVFGGESYQATGSTRGHTTFQSLPYETSFVNNFKIIGRKSGNNLLIHETMHVTINGKGVLTTSFDKISVTCR